jgi:hypothetical protein
VYKTDREAAFTMIDAAITASPFDGNLRMVLGHMLLASGRNEAAFSTLSDAMTIGTEVEVLALMAEAAYPGPRYTDHLLALHKWLEPAVYLEIGVFKGDTLALARPPTRATGVDPQPRPESVRVYDAPTRILQVTSDAYFAGLAVYEGPRPATVDLAFIDGLHLYEQVLRDFINIEKLCGRGSVIVLHDTLPIAAAATARQRQTSHWCGDVWKIRPCLQAYRPDLSMLTIPTYPSGLTLVVGLDPGSHVLADHYDTAVADFASIELSSPTERSGDVRNDFGAVQGWLEAHGVARLVRV